ncbi:MAG: DivIVA domain-containing protein [Desulfarculus sp.]|jgi:cell division initiation protein|nr:MAG: DivIVA domain-containing protein [Desulfarculus sp.]
MDAHEIRQKEFSRRLRGADPRDVNTFLGKVADYVVGLQQELQLLEQRLSDARGEIKEYKSREQTVEATLAQTRKVAEEIKSNAEKEAQFAVAEAELQAEKILSQAHTRLARIHEDIAELKRQRAQFEVRLRSLIEAHVKLMDVETERDHELNELEDKIKILRGPSS